MWVEKNFTSSINALNEIMALLVQCCEVFFNQRNQFWPLTAEIFGSFLYLEKKKKKKKRKKYKYLKTKIV